MKHNSPLINEHGIFQRRPAKLIELAELYGMSKDTLRRTLKKYADLIGKRNGHFYSSLQVKKITEIMGYPDNLDVDKEL